MSFLAPKPDVPAFNPAPAQDLGDETKKAKKQRAALLSTEGGMAGQELQTGQVSARGTLFGN